MTTTAEKTERIVRRIPEEIANQRDLNAIDQIFTEDAVDHTPFGEFRGRDEIKEQFKGILDTFPDFTVTVDDVFVEGDTAAVRVTQRGTHDGEFMGIEPTGQEFEMQTMAFVRMEGGKVAERWIQPDLLGLMLQLGVIELPNM